MDGMSGRSFGTNRWQMDCLYELWDFLEQLLARIRNPKYLAGDLLVWMVETLGYLDYFGITTAKGNTPMRRAWLS